jgi:ZIP family zinc transporter
MVNPALLAVLLSAAAGGATGLGAVPLLLKRRFTHRFYDSMIGLSAGVMLSAAIFSLVDPALKLGASWEVIGGFASGLLFVAILNRVIPHAHTRFTREGEVTKESRRGILLAGAVTIHNLPEGFAVGVGYLSGMPEAGLILALAIMIHNVPEGFAVAYPFYEYGKSSLACLGIATLSGLAEPVGALFGTLLVTVEEAVLQFGLGFAGGAMVYVVLVEMVPESHKHGYARIATAMMIVGFTLVLALDSFI